MVQLKSRIENVYSLTGAEGRDDTASGHTYLARPDVMLGETRDRGSIAISLWTGVRQAGALAPLAGATDRMGRPTCSHGDNPRLPALAESDAPCVKDTQHAVMACA